MMYLYRLFGSLVMLMLIMLYIDGFFLAQEVMTALEQFYKFREAWDGERDQIMAEFMKNGPHLSEFESQIVHFERLEEEILGEAEHYDVGPIALYTGTFFHVVETPLSEPVYTEH